MIGTRARPRLAAHVRVRADRSTGRTWLLSPERGLLLNATAAAVVALCTGELEMEAIVERLAVTFGCGGDEIARDVRDLLCALYDRGLLRDGRVEERR